MHVVFRKLKINNQVLCLCPNETLDNRKEICFCSRSYSEKELKYNYVDYNETMQDSVAAAPDEYKDLLNFLTEKFPDEELEIKKEKSVQMKTDTELLRGALEREQVKAWEFINCVRTNEEIVTTVMKISEACNDFLTIEKRLSLPPFSEPVYETAQPPPVYKKK